MYIKPMIIHARMNRIEPTIIIDIIAPVTAIPIIKDKIPHNILATDLKKPIIMTNNRKMFVGNTL